MTLDFSDIKVLLIGDFMIDHYIAGKSTRLSPEAPVPVVEPEKEYSIPGGAGNVAMNLSSMGAQVSCQGTVGNDKWGKKLVTLLNEKGINTRFINIVDQHPTTLKQRIYANGKQILRIDKEKYLEWIKTEEIDYSEYDVIIFSDYNKGVIKNIDIDANFIIVDPKKNDFSLYKNANIITPNVNELQRATKIKITDDLSIVDACNELIRKNNFDYIVAKKGHQGMSIIGKNNFVKHIPASEVKNPDVTGAGDTVVATLSLAYARSHNIEFSSNLANFAAGIVVAKPGTGIVTIDEINNYIELNK